MLYSPPTNEEKEEESSYVPYGAAGCNSALHQVSEFRLPFTGVLEPDPYRFIRKYIYFV